MRTEEQQNNSFAEALAGRISKECFKWLDGPVEVLGAANVPAIPLNMNLENAVLPNAEKLQKKLKAFLIISIIGSLTYQDLQSIFFLLLFQ